MAKRRDFEKALGRLFDENRGPHGQCEERAHELITSALEEPFGPPPAFLPRDEAEALATAFVEACGTPRAVMGNVLFALLRLGLLDWPEDDSA